MRSPTRLAAFIGLGIAPLAIATASPSQSPAAASSEADRLDAADKQSFQDAVHGHYIEASFGLLTKPGVTTAAGLKDPDVFDQWAQVMSTMTGTGTLNPAKGPDFQVPAGQVADLRTADGYTRQSSGYYLDDPVFSDFLRQSLRLGYRLASYGFGGAFVSDAQRDRDETGNLVRRALGRYPGAKFLISSGEHHAAKRPIAVEGGKAEWMAQMLKEATGIDPLTIDQAGLTPIPMNRPSAEFYDVAVQKAHDQPIVLMRHGKPLSVGLLAGSVDLQV